MTHDCLKFSGCCVEPLDSDIKTEIASSRPESKATV